MEIVEKVFKTPSYQRKAYQNYYNKNKDDETFKNIRKQKQREYYLKNREKILEKKRKKKTTNTINSDEIVENDVIVVDFN
tara:strand:- start:65 stop:304 length:240 start_codon:yes stop_codon:yes gene_type:complete